jgi:hypothetical protein
MLTKMRIFSLIKMKYKTNSIVKFGQNYLRKFLDKAVQFWGKVGLFKKLHRPTQKTDASTQFDEIFQMMTNIFDDILTTGVLLTKFLFNLFSKNYCNMDII